MVNKANYKDGVTGTLIAVKDCKTGSIRISIKKDNGHIVNPLMTSKFPQLPSVRAKAIALEGQRVSTMVSQTTDSFSADKFFADIKEVM